MIRRAPFLYPMAAYRSRYIYMLNEIDIPNQPLQMLDRLFTKG